MTACGMSDADYKQILAKYNGEVYYIRGLFGQSHHISRKSGWNTASPRPATYLNAKMKMDPVFQTSITNNYWLQIAKLRREVRLRPRSFSSSASGRHAENARSSSITHARHNQTQPGKFRSS